MAAPTFVTEYESAWNADTTPKTQSVTVNNGDILVIVGVTADSVTTLGTPTGGGLTYTARGAINTSSRCSVYAWSAPASSSQTFTLSIARSGSTGVFWGFNVLRFSGSSGVGANPSTNATGAPTLNVTATAANSAIVVVNGDWNAADGTSRTWRTNAGALTEQTYFRDSGQYTVYVGYHADAGTATTDAVGLSAPTGQAYSIIALEVLGSTATNVSPTHAAGTVAAQNPAPAVTPSVGSPAGTVTANNAAPSTSTRPSDATMAVAGHNAASSVTSPGGGATGTLAAAAPTIGLRPSGAGASGVVTGHDAAPTVTPNAVGAALTVSALNPTVTTGGAATNAQADTATVSLTAVNGAGAIAGTAGAGTVTVGAPNATVNTSSATNAQAVAATATLTAVNGAAAIAGAASVAAIAAIASNPAPTVATSPAVPTVGVSALNASTRVTTSAQSAGITVSASDATVTIPGATNANATVATVGMSALNATVLVGARAVEATLSATAALAASVITVLAEHAVITLPANGVATEYRGGHMSAVDATGPGMSSVDRTVQTMRGA